MLSPTFAPIFSNWVETMASPNTTLAMEYDATATMLNGMMTREDAQAAFDSMDDSERFLGNYVVDNATESAFHPCESSGAAFMLLDDGSAIHAQWTDSGFWYVTLYTENEARREINRLEHEYDFADDYDLTEEEE